MTPSTHLASGYLVYRAAAFLGATQSANLLLLSMLGSFAPDIDGLFPGQRMNNHRNTIFHTPFFWILACLLALLFLQISRPGFLIYSLVFFIGSFLHLFLDWVSARTGGVRLFYPFSQKAYSLFPLSLEHGDIPVLPNGGYKNFWKFYFQNTFLIIVEASIILFASFLLL